VCAVGVTEVAEENVSAAAKIFPWIGAALRYAAYSLYTALFCLIYSIRCGLSDDTFDHVQIAPAISSDAPAP
jgi:hypothetical protein